MGNAKPEYIEPSSLLIMWQNRQFVVFYWHRTIRFWTNLQSERNALFSIAFISRAIFVQQTMCIENSSMFVASIFSHAFNFLLCIYFRMFECMTGGVQPYGMQNSAWKNGTKLKCCKMCLEARFNCSLCLYIFTQRAKIHT